MMWGPIHRVTGTGSRFQAAMAARNFGFLGVRSGSGRPASRTYYRQRVWGARPLFLER